MKKLFSLTGCLLICSIFLSYGQTVPKMPLFEEFTSSTCGPCAGLNVSLDPMLSSTLMANQPGSNLAVIKYQMNWPSPYNDPSYNADASTRKNFYSVNSIPMSFLNGLNIPGADALNAATYQNAALSTSTIDLDLYYTLTGNKLEATAIVKPLADFPTAVRVYIAVTEDYYSYPGSTTSQDEYHFVCRKMLPSGNGNVLLSLTANQNDTITKSFTFTLGNVTQNSYNLWSDLENVTVVAFVQDANTKEVLQSTFTNWEGTAGMADHKGPEQLMVYPNPVSHTLNISFQQAENTASTIFISDVLGRHVQYLNKGSLSAGNHNFHHDVSSLPAGLYKLIIQSDAGTISKSISILNY